MHICIHIYYTHEHPYNILLKRKKGINFKLICSQSKNKNGDLVLQSTVLYDCTETSEECAFIITNSQDYRFGEKKEHKKYKITIWM